MKTKEVYVCDYCGAEFESNIGCNSHEKTCTDRLKKELISNIHFRNSNRCDNCKYFQKENSDSWTLHSPYICHKFSTKVIRLSDQLGVCDYYCSDK